jgi:hypothetical protein
MSKIGNLDEAAYVEVLNNTESSIGYTTPSGRSSVWPAPTRREREIKKRVRLSELYDAMGQPAAAKMFREGKLLIKDSDAREALGLAPLSKYTPDVAETDKLLKEASLQELEDVVLHCSDGILDRLVDRAILMPIDDMNKAKVLEEYSGKKVFDLAREYAEELKAKGEDEAPTTSSSIPEGAKRVRRKKVTE